MLLSQAVGSKFGNVWRSYCNQLQRKPLLTKCITGVVGSVIADTAAQYSAHYFKNEKLQRRSLVTGVNHESPTFKFDFARCARLCVWAAIGATPITHYWFMLLDQRIMPGSPKHPAAVLFKLAFDQLLMAPVGICAFYAAMRTLEGKPAEGLPTIREKLVPTLHANWILWPAANLVNFAVIPPQQRILYINVIAIGWTCFLSHMAAGQDDSAEAVALKAQ